MSVPTFASTANPRRAGYDAALGQLLVKLAAGPERPLVTEMAPLQPERIDTSQTPEDFRPEFGDVHSQDSWVGGEGLIDRFRRDGGEHDGVRFWASKGVNVSASEQGRPEQMRLLPTTEVVDALAGRIRMTSHGQTVWATSGQTIRKSEDATAAAASFVDDDPHDSETPTDVEDVAALGEVPYAALGTNGIHRDDGGWEHWSDVEAVRVWGVLDRIVASDGPALYEATAGDGSVLLYTLPEGEQWSEVVDAAGAMVAAATNGFVYVFQVDDNAELVVVSQTRLKGERPAAMAARANLLFIAAVSGDELRLWRAQVQQGVVGDLQLMREWHACGCGAMTATRDRVFIGVNEDDSTHLWQVELAPVFGIFRSLQVPHGPVDGVVSVGDRMFVGVRDEGVARQADLLEASGWLIGPLSDFFRADMKSWVSGWADVKVPFGTQVQLFYTTERDALLDPDHPSWTRVRSYASDSSGQENPLGDVFSRSLAAKVVLSSDGISSPVVRSVAFRAFPGPGDVLARLPVDVGDQVERPGRRRISVPGRGQKTMGELRQLEGRSVLCRIFSTDETIRGLIEQVTTPVPSIAPRGSVTYVSMVTVRGRRVDEASTIDTFGWSSYGSAMWGAMSWGGELLEED